LFSGFREAALADGLVVAPGYDYHWYRKQLEGFWGHKPGGTAARNYETTGTSS